MDHTLLGKVLTDLAAYPSSTAREVATRLGEVDDRAVWALLCGAERDGRCQRSRYSPHWPWEWEVPPPVPGKEGE